MAPPNWDSTLLLVDVFCFVTHSLNKFIEDNNTRVVFERILSSGAMPAEKSGYVYLVLFLLVICITELNVEF